jgi:hypothetical protein
MLSHFVLSLVSAIALAAPQATQAQQEVSVPNYPNVSCPIMGKPISQKLFVDTEKGRFWVCCKACYKDILADLDTAHAVAYPKVEKLKNATCPWTAEPIGKDSPRVVLQGFEFSIARKELLDEARANSQIVLAKLVDPKLVDVGNRVSPIDGAPIAPNSFVVVAGSIVRKDAPKALARAKEIAAQQPKVAPKPSATGEKSGAER